MSVHEHFHPQGKQPSAVTKALQDGLRESLPLSDVRDFEEARRGFLAAPDYRQIQAEAGHVAWNIGAYDFLLQDEEHDSIHTARFPPWERTVSCGPEALPPGVEGSLPRRLSVRRL